METFEDAKKLMEYAFTDYNTVRPYSSIEYLSPDEFERRWNGHEKFRKEFVEVRAFRTLNEKNLKMMGARSEMSQRFSREDMEKVIKEIEIQSKSTKPLS